MNSSVDQEDCVNSVYQGLPIPRFLGDYTNAQTMDTTGHSFSCSMGVCLGTRLIATVKKETLPTPC